MNSGCNIPVVTSGHLNLGSESPVWLVCLPGPWGPQGPHSGIALPLTLCPFPSSIIAPLLLSLSYPSERVDLGKDSITPLNLGDKAPSDQWLTLMGDKLVGETHLIPCRSWSSRLCLIGDCENDRGSNLLLDSGCTSDHTDILTSIFLLPREVPLGTQ